MNRNKNLVKELAGARIERLFSLANRVFAKDPELSKRYIRLLVRMGTHYKVALPDEIKRGICKGCFSPLVVGVNVQTRIVSSHGYVATRCLGCGSETHKLLSARRRGGR